ncbi:MAG: alpha/beta fold hydrolase [Acidimicrobiia bacterium]
MALRAFADGALFAEAIGDGPPRVLALHGWGRRGADYRHALAGMDALAVDLPGFGASPVPVEAQGADGYAQAIAPILDEFETPPVVVGHSFGGRVAVCLSAANPSRIKGLVLTASPLVRSTRGRRPSLGYRVIRSLNRARIVSDARMEQVRQRQGSPDYRAAGGVMRDVLVKVVNESYEPQLRALRLPVVLLWGAEDREVPVAVAETAMRLIRGSGGAAELEVLPGVGHLVPTEAPDDLRRVVEEALGR